MVTLDQAGWNRSTLVLQPAPLALSDLIEFLWIDERPRHSRLRHQWRVVADDAPHIIYSRFDNASGVSHRLNVVGARTLYTDVDCTQRVLTAGARLRPGVIPMLFNISASEFTNRGVDASLVTVAARLTIDRLERAQPADTLTHIVSFVNELARRGGVVDDRVRGLAALDSSGRSVRDIARALGIGDRALRSWSATHLGLGLRRFRRIRRLHTAIEARLRNPCTPWSRIAAATGFADQPHLVRDCRALLGESPTEFFARAR